MRGGGYLRDMLEMQIIGAAWELNPGGGVWY